MNGCAKPTVVISGAAHGVGKASARLLARQGAKLILCDVDGPALGRLAGELGVEGAFCDVESETSVRIFAHAVALNHGPVDVLVNAAGAAYVRSPGILRLSNALLPCLKHRKGGLIVNVASSTLSCDNAQSFRFASSRDAFVRLSSALGERLVAKSIAVEAVLPCGCPTDRDRSSEAVAAHVRGWTERSVNQDLNRRTG